MRLLFHIGRYMIMLRSMFVRPENTGMYWKETLRQMKDIGIGSLGIISIVALFIGGVTAIQFAYQLQDSFVPLWYVGFVVRDSMILELAPTISCLLLAGKVGSNMASELGTMRLTEQIDALEIMGVNTTAYLVMPKVVASIFIVPILVIFSAFLGIMGGMLAGISSGVFTAAEYNQGVQDAYVAKNTIVLIIKAAAFAYILSSISCFQGFYVSGGALDIGRASTRAVVFSSIAIIVADYVLALILL